METGEMVDIVDENDGFVRKAARKEVEEKRLLHRISRVIVVNNEGEMLVQKRSKSKQTRPGWWDIGVTETLQSGESYESAAIRGMMEEVGIIGVSNIQMMHSLLAKVRHQSQTSNVICKVYELAYDGKIIPNPNEVEEAAFMTAKQIEKLIDEGRLTPGGIATFRKYEETRKK